MSHKSAKRARRLACEINADSRRFVQLFQKCAQDAGATPFEARKAAKDLAQALHQAPDAAAKLLPDV